MKKPSRIFGMAFLIYSVLMVQRLLPNYGKTICRMLNTINVTRDNQSICRLQFLNDDLMWGWIKKIPIFRF